MHILILEDNRERREAMRKCLDNRFPDFSSVFFEVPQPMLAFLRERIGEAALISLDHDMELVEDAQGRLSDPGTGREIADYLATQPPQCPVIIHSTNTAAAVGMESVLSESGWTVCRVAPYGDLDWVRGEWYRTLRAVIG